MKAWFIAALLAIAVLIIVYLASRPETVVVNLEIVEKGQVEKTVANTRAGTIEACQRSKLSLPIGGQIDKIFVKEGERVERNQLLITLWNKDRKARVDEAVAARLSATKERESVCISSKSDTREALRRQGLARKELVSQESADLAKSKAEASEARCEAAAAKENQVAASLEVAKAIYEQTELRAPFAGIVAEVTGKIGEYATPSPPGVSTPPAIDLITDDCHYISAPLDEVDASAIRVGMPVKISLDAYRDRHFPAKVRRIAPYVLDFEKQARTVEVEADFSELNEGVILLAGYSADMEIILETHNNVLRIPSELIMDNEFVLLLNAEGFLEKRKIQTGLSNWRFTEVISGLSQGDQIVRNIGSTGVKEGAKAEVGTETNGAY